MSLHKEVSFETEICQHLGAHEVRHRVDERTRRERPAQVGGVGARVRRAHLGVVQRREVVDRDDGGQRRREWDEVRFVVEVVAGGAAVQGEVDADRGFAEVLGERFEFAQRPATVVAGLPFRGSGKLLLELVDDSTRGFAGIESDGVAEGGMEARDPLQVVVYRHEGRDVGLVVENIVDIVEEQLTVHRRERQGAVYGTAVIQQKVTDLLDVRALIEQADVLLFAGADAEPVGAGV